MMIRLILCLYVFIQSAFSFLDEGKLKDAVNKYTSNNTNLLITNLTDYTKNGKKPTDTQILDYLSKDKDFNFEKKITFQGVIREANEKEEGDLDKKPLEFSKMKSFMLSDFVLSLYAGDVPGYNLTNGNPSATPVNKKMIAKVLFRAGQWAQLGNNLKSYVDVFTSKTNNDKAGSKLHRHFSNCLSALEDSMEDSSSKLRLYNYYIQDNDIPIDYVHSWIKYRSIDKNFCQDSYYPYLFFKNYFDHLSLKEMKNKIDKIKNEINPSDKEKSDSNDAELLVFGEFSIEQINRSKEIEDKLMPIKAFSRGDIADVLSFGLKTEKNYTQFKKWISDENIKVGPEADRDESYWPGYSGLIGMVLNENFNDTRIKEVEKFSRDHMIAAAFVAIVLQGGENTLGKKIKVVPEEFIKLLNELLQGKDTDNKGQKDTQLRSTFAYRLLFSEEDTPFDAPQRGPNFYNYAKIHKNEVKKILDNRDNVDLFEKLLLMKIPYREAIHLIKLIKDEGKEKRAEVMNILDQVHQIVSRMNVTDTDWIKRQESNNFRELMVSKLLSMNTLDPILKLYKKFQDEKWRFDNSNADSLETLWAEATAD